MSDPAMNITPAELRIMKVLWELGDATVGEVKDRLATESEDPPAYTTVMTMMKQLAAKGALQVDRTRQPFLYRAAVRKEAVLSDRLRHFLHTVFDGQAGELVLRLVEDADLSEDDLRRIEAMVDRKERAARGDSDASGGRKPGRRRS
jgi:predicted transcriptional regulator